MNKTIKTVLITVCILAGLYVCLVRVSKLFLHPEVPTQETSKPTDIVSLFLESDTPRLTQYKGRRTLRATTSKGLSALMLVTTELNNGKFSYTITKEQGSGIIRSRVLKAALEAELEQLAHASSIAFTPENYTFRAIRYTEELTRIAIEPKRTSPFLLSGTLTVKRENGDLVHVDGTLSESPSTWVRNVRVSKDYDRIAGVRVPVKVVSLADVSLVGESSFTMTYTYTEINGKGI